MVIGVFGLPRSGKTTFLAKMSKQALAGKKQLTVGGGAWKVALGDFAPYAHVYSNFPLQGCERIEFKDLGRYDTNRSLILIDEISLFADARDYKTFDKVIKEWFALHGHYRTDVVYCSQGYEDTDKRIRNLTEIMLYIERFGAFTRVRPIRKAWSIDGSITEGFTLAPPLSSSWIWRRRYYDRFDSFAAPALPPMPSALWKV